MNHTIRVDFRDEHGRAIAGELVNGYRLIESVTSPVGIAAEIDIVHHDTVDVFVFEGDDMFLHRVPLAHIFGLDEVTV